jgi:hypothetical protein
LQEAIAKLKLVLLDSEFVVTARALDQLRGSDRPSIAPARMFSTANVYQSAAACLSLR